MISTDIFHDVIALIFQVKKPDHQHLPRFADHRLTLQNLNSEGRIQYLTSAFTIHILTTDMIMSTSKPSLHYVKIFHLKYAA